MSSLTKVLKKLELKSDGYYKNNFYIIDLDSSDEYSRMYTLLDKNAINTEYPNFEKNSSSSVTKVINYFELEIDQILYNIFLIANFKDDIYQIKIGEK